MLCADMIEVHWVPPGGRGRQITALLEDISPRGACLQMEENIPVHSRISWKSPTQEFAGLVRYCEYRQIGYFVGVEFTPGTEWSESSYAPAHLLKL